MITPELLQSLRDLAACPALQVVSSPDWGSDQPGNRLLIRQYLKNYLQNRLTLPEHDQLMDLEWIPSFPHTYISISHTKDMGLIATAPVPVGIDIESIARVQARAVARVSNPEEVTAAPTPAHLWAAKEAAFKALYSFDQPSVVSQITIGDWRKIDSQTETFSLLNASDFKTSSSGCGITVKLSTLVACFFVFNS